MKLLLCAAVAALAIASGVSAVVLRSADHGPRYPSGIPVNAYLNAPWTAFSNTPEQNLNTTVVPKYFKHIKDSGVNVVFTPGGFGQFDTLTTAERKEWVAVVAPEAHRQGLYAICHVGTTVQREAVELAAHAAKAGCPAIASVPPYYAHASDGVQGIVDFFKPIVNASGGLPFFYYHIPGETGVDITMQSFLPLAIAQIPSFAGVKYVSSDTKDYFFSQKLYGDKVQLMWAPEPKLQSFVLGARGFVLAESFYAWTLIRMTCDYLRGNASAAFAENMWKYKVDAIFGKYGGNSAKRQLYTYTAGIDIDVDRAPKIPQPMNATVFDAFIGELRAVGFFNQTKPEKNSCIMPKIF